jgi:hypothetical protein
LINYPDFLGYFNTVVGRSAGHGISIVGDDWGQDEMLLVEYLKKKKLKPLYYAPGSLGGEVELTKQGIKFKKIRCRQFAKKKLSEPAYFVIHASALYCRQCLPKRGVIEEIDRINDHTIVMRYWPK